MTTYCVYAELKKLGPDFRVSAAMAKKLEKRRCSHSPAVTASECIKHLFESGNKNNYFVASQDFELRKHLEQIPCCPLLTLHKGVLMLEPLSEATTAKASQVFIVLI